MRSSTIAALAAIAVASPVLSAPLSDGTYARELLSRQVHNEARGELLSTLAAPGFFGQSGGPYRGHGPVMVTPVAQRREFEESVARELLDHLVARDAVDESGAINWGKIIHIIPDVIKGASDILGGGSAPPPPPQPSQPAQRREFDDLVAREVINTLLSRDDDESGAFKIPTFVQHLPGIVEHLLPLFGGGSAPPPPPPPPPAPAPVTSDPTTQSQRREVEDLVARELFNVLAARDSDVDPSGAINFGKILSGIPKVVDGFEQIFGGGGSAPAPQPSQSAQPQRRELKEFVARELFDALVARDDTDQSGAINIGKIFGIIPKVVDGLGQIFGGGDNDNSQQRREFEELSMRAIMSQMQPIIPRPSNRLNTMHQQPIRQKGQTKHQGHQHHQHHHHHQHHQQQRGNNGLPAHQGKNSVKASSTGSVIPTTTDSLPLSASGAPVASSSGTTTTNTAASMAPTGQNTARSLNELD
ncbi:hypothetical protein QCA50_004269 [Cerrena zonata]|uniref:Uncharacterized protein n=1 Tax=Cerrena zonata TaxID=2478898 RepID=A0AAW0GIR8_9APHY